MSKEELAGVFFLIIMLLVGFRNGMRAGQRPIKIQEVKQLDTGYYITINNEIYEYEIVKE